MNVILTIAHIFGLVTLCFSALMSTCLVTSEIVGDGAMDAFFKGTSVTLLVGSLLFFSTLWIPKKVSRQAVFCWLR